MAAHAHHGTLLEVGFGAILRRLVLIGKVLVNGLEIIAHAQTGTPACLNHNAIRSRLTGKMLRRNLGLRNTGKSNEHEYGKNKITHGANLSWFSNTSVFFVPKDLQKNRPGPGENEVGRFCC